MDGPRFDALARRLAAGASRRGFLRGAFIAVAASGLSRSSGVEAANCPPEQVPGRGGCLCRTTGRPADPSTGLCPCPTGQTRCGAECVDTRRDPAHCGACGNVCPSPAPGTCEGDAICRNGACELRPAPAGTVCRPASGPCEKPGICDGQTLACPPASIQPDGFPCDADGDGCSTGDACRGGVCVAGLPLECPPCQTCQGGACQAITNDPRCDTVCCNGECCPAGQGCFGGDGACAPAPCQALGEVCWDESECCQDGVTLCDGICCHPAGESCTDATQCCTGRCNGEFCCSGPRGSCTSDGDCCDGRLGACDQGSCRCASAGDACASTFECCDGLSCRDGQCRPDACQPLQGVCVEDADCCQDRPTYCRQSCSDVNLCCRLNRETCSSDCDCCGGYGACQGGQCCQTEGGACSLLTTDPGCCAGLTCRGGTCQLACPTGTRRCGNECCPNERACCNGICCAAEEECFNNVCRACLALQATCDPAINQCCQADGPTICPADNPYGNSHTCCRPLGGSCRSAADCCREVYDMQWGRDTCGDDGICGGDNAYCNTAVDCVDGLSCIGLCTGLGAGFELCKLDGHPCPAGQVCSQLRCTDPDDLPESYGSCVDDADCDAGMICIGLCTGTGMGFDLCAQTNQCPAGLLCRQKRCTRPEDLPI